VNGLLAVSATAAKRAHVSTRSFMLPIVTAFLSGGCCLYAYQLLFFGLVVVLAHTIGTSSCEQADEAGKTYQCTCAAGWTSSGEPNVECDDVDECTVPSFCIMSTSILCTFRRSMMIGR
jgi:hypothetical protein